MSNITARTLKRGDSQNRRDILSTPDFWCGSKLSGELGMERRRILGSLLEDTVRGNSFQNRTVVVFLRGTSLSTWYERKRILRQGATH